MTDEQKKRGRPLKTLPGRPTRSAERLKKDCDALASFAGLSDDDPRRLEFDQIVHEINSLRGTLTADIKRELPDLIAEERDAKTAELPEDDPRMEALRGRRQETEERLSKAQPGVWESEVIFQLGLAWRAGGRQVGTSSGTDDRTGPFVRFVQKTFKHFQFEEPTGEAIASVLKRLQEDEDDPFEQDAHSRGGEGARGSGGELVKHVAHLAQEIRAGVDEYVPADAVDGEDLPEPQDLSGEAEAAPAERFQMPRTTFRRWREVAGSGEPVVGDILEVFDRSRADRLTSEDLAAGLRELPDRPWWTDLNPRELAEFLKPLGTKPAPLRISGSDGQPGRDRRGYKRIWFE